MFVLADKATNNIIVVCKRYYLDVICKELGLWPGATSNHTYIPETMDTKEIRGNHICFLKEITCLTRSLAFIGLQRSTKHHTSIVLSLHHLTAQKSFVCTIYPYLPSKGNCQTSHQSYKVAQVSMKRG